jgi:hypothetical protein
LLNLTAPRTNSLEDIRGLLDAVQFGNKSNQGANKARDQGKDPSFNETAREVNEAFALATVNRLIPQTEPGWQRAQQIVSDIISGKIRDPRPEFPPGAGAPPSRGGFQRNGPGGGTGQFRSRTRDQDSPQERPRLEQPLRGEEVNRYKPKNEQEQQQQEVAQQEVAPQEVVQPEVVQPEVVQQKVVQPEVVQQKVVQPEVIQPETLRQQVEPVSDSPVKLEQVTEGTISQGLADLLRQSAAERVSNGEKSGAQVDKVVDATADGAVVNQPAVVHEKQVYTVEDGASGKYGGKAGKQKRQRVEEEDEWGDDGGSNKRNKPKRTKFRRGFEE